MNVDDRCFCGATWIDEREECANGHGFGESDKWKARAEKLAALVRDALSKGAERRCPWCWVVANKGKHSPDCRAKAALKEMT